MFFRLADLLAMAAGLIFAGGSQQEETLFPQRRVFGVLRVDRLEQQVDNIPHGKRSASFLESPALEEFRGLSCCSVAAFGGFEYLFQSAVEPLRRKLPQD